MPLFSFHESGGVKSALFIGEGIWKWRIKNYREKENHKAFNELFQKSVTDALALAEKKERFQVEVGKRFSSSEAITFDAIALDATYTPTENAQLGAIIKNEEGEEFSYLFEPRGQYFFGCRFFP